VLYGQAVRAEGGGGEVRSGSMCSADEQWEAAVGAGAGRPAHHVRTTRHGGGGGGGGGGSGGHPTMCAEPAAAMMMSAFLQIPSGSAVRLCTTVTVQSFRVWRSRFMI
jgi:hypothetical protein